MEANRRQRDRRGSAVKRDTNLCQLGARVFTDVSGDTGANALLDLARTQHPLHYDASMSLGEADAVLVAVTRAKCSQVREVYVVYLEEVVEKLLERVLLLGLEQEEIRLAWETNGVFNAVLLPIWTESQSDVPSVV